MYIYQCIFFHHYHDIIKFAPILTSPVLTGLIYTTLTATAQPKSGAPYFSEKSLKKVLFFRHNRTRLPLRKLQDDGDSLLTSWLISDFLYEPGVVSHKLAFLLRCCYPCGYPTVVGGLASASQDRKPHCSKIFSRKHSTLDTLFSLYNLAFSQSFLCQALLRSLFIR